MSIALSVGQLLEERTTLSTFLLHSVFLQRTAGLRQLSGDDNRTVEFEIKYFSCAIFVTYLSLRLFS